MAALFVDAWSILFMLSMAMERRASPPAGRAGRPSLH
jgi:hypothetical protein